jgi:serine/threonine-protein kinase
MRAIGGHDYGPRMPDLPVGSLFGGHRIEGVVGRGGMGVVYRVRHLRLDAPMALKLITDARADDPEFRARFEREARLAAQLRHPNVVRVFDAGEQDGVLYVTMDLIEGTDLRELIAREGRLEAPRATRILAQVASALDVAHARGLIHRDVKPANILVEGPPGGEHAYLTDFGLTKHMTSDSAFTQTGALVGTLDYMAPEQIRGTALGPQADVYALACVLFHSLTGRQPFRRDSQPAVMTAHLFEPPPAPSSVVEGLPRGFDAVIPRGMAKEPGERFQSAGELARAAADSARGAPAEGAPAPTVSAAPAPTAAAASPPPTGPPPPSPPLAAPAIPSPHAPAAPAPRRSRRGLWAGLAVGAALLAVVAVVAIVLVASGGGEDGSSDVTAAQARAVILDYADSYNDNDVPGLRRSLAPDVTLRKTGSRPYGRDQEIRNSSSSVSQGVQYNVSNIRVDPSGEQASATSRYEATQNGTSFETGSYDLHLSRRDGRLQIDRLVYTPD